MYIVISTQTGRQLSKQFDTKTQAMMHVLDLESQDLIEGCYKFGSYDVREVLA